MKKCAVFFQMALSWAINMQQNIPSFVNIAGYMTHYKLCCDVTD